MGCSYRFLEFSLKGVEGLPERKVGVYRYFLSRRTLLGTAWK